MLVGESTRRAVGPAVFFEAAGEHVLKGKPAPVPAFRAVRLVGERRGGPNDIVEPPFVGRDDELRLLKDSFHATGRDGRARLLSIVGQAGIGKRSLGSRRRPVPSLGCASDQRSEVYPIRCSAGEPYGGCGARFARLACPHCQT